MMPAPPPAAIVAPAPAAPSTATRRTPRREFLALGDSLSFGGYADLVGKRFGVPVVNAGIGGQTAPQIAARYGAIPVHIIVPGGRIVAGANPLSVVAPEILRGSDAATRSAWVRIAGILGVYTYGLGADGKPVNTFTPQPGQALPVAAPAGTPMQLETGEMQSDMLLVCAGRNGGIEKPDVLMADIAAIMAAYKPEVRRIVLLGVTNSATPDEARGTPRYNAIVQINQTLARLYPDAFLDIRAAYNAGGPTAAADGTERENDWPPAALRKDQIHYNDAGKRVWAQAVGDFIARKRWLKDSQR